MFARSIATTAHGRYLVVPPPEPGAPLLVSFHGYAEACEAALERIAAIPGAESWCRVAVQGLNRFYRGRTEEVVASWMTRQDRELAIADNIAYVAAVVATVRDEWHLSRQTVYAGFSQGVAMAFRAATSDTGRARVIACGGDVPPEFDWTALAKLDAVLIGRGERDEWYTASKLEADQARLRAAGVDLRTTQFDGGHEWTASFNQAAGAFLRSIT